MKPGPQAGILNRPSEHLLTAGLSFATGTDAAAARQTLDLLADVVRRELQSDLEELTATTDKAASSAETGELGVVDGWDRGHLTITFGISASGFDVLGYPEGHQQRPNDLIAVPWGGFKDTPPPTPAGDLLLHINSDNVYVVEHVLRRVEHQLADRLSTVWTLLGSQRYGSRQGRVATSEARALIGFHDGLSNLDPAHKSDDYDLVFIDPKKVPSYPANPPEGPQPTPQPGQPGYGGPQSAGPIFPSMRQVPTSEPDWTKGGTYAFVRGSVFEMAAWDTHTLGAQETAVGRWKYSGAFMDQVDDPKNRDAAPAFASDPTNVGVPLTAHVRRANPRTSPTDAQRRIFRRGYPLMLSGTGGSLQRGLLFVSFSRSLGPQVEFIFKVWLRNENFPTPQAGLDPLLALDKSVVAGGYFFIPPLTDKHKPWTWALPPTA